MSRIAKQPIPLPAGVTANIEAGDFSIKGPLGNLSRRFRDDVKITITEEGVVVASAHGSILANALSGTYASHIRNMVEGVTKGFEKQLLIEGVGYRYAVNGDKVKLDLGFSHPVEILIPAGLKVVTEKSKMMINGFDKELVGGFAAKIRSLKRVEPYKGKGIRYSDEVVRRKQGKKAGATA
ncbi:MAG: 50S ribosomal protein L6 [Candidatus Vogelbacteria bacterium]|nr:50S ribosomal protein L6 [Candidatus Vogelbacteria bacterium]